MLKREGHYGLNNKTYHIWTDLVATTPINLLKILFITNDATETSPIISLSNDWLPCESSNYNRMGVSWHILLATKQTNPKGVTNSIPLTSRRVWCVRLLLLVPSSSDTSKVQIMIFLTKMHMIYFKSLQIYNNKTKIINE